MTQHTVSKSRYTLNHFDSNKLKKNWNQFDLATGQEKDPRK